MNASVENALAAWLTGAGITAPVHTGASAEEFDPEALTLIVSVPDLEHSVGPIHRANGLAAVLTDHANLAAWTLDAMKRGQPCPVWHREGLDNSTLANART
jgi:hypothetical protein